MNKAVKNISVKESIPYNINSGIFICNELADKTTRWVKKHPCPIPTGAQFAGAKGDKKWWDDRFASQLQKAIELGKVTDKVVFAYLKSCYYWAGLRHGFQFQYPNSSEVYGRYLCI